MSNKLSWYLEGGHAWSLLNPGGMLMGIKRLEVVIDNNQWQR